MHKYHLKCHLIFVCKYRKKLLDGDMQQNFWKEHTFWTSIILANLFSETIVPLYNDEILNEYEEVLHRTKFRFPESDVRLVLSAIAEFGISSERVECAEDFPELLRQ